MGVVSIPKRVTSVAKKAARNADSIDWVNVAAGSALVIGGLLYLSDKRRAGLAVATAGTALALLEQEDAVRNWWGRIPDYVEQVQHLIGSVQSKVDEITAKRESLQDAINSAIHQTEKITESF